jgi:stage II sporulation SpoAA-like protein
MTGRDDTYFSVPGVATVRWDEPHQTVFVEWDGWANSAEFTALLDAEVRALQEHGGSRLLADCRRQRVLNPADQERADREWTPRAIGAGLRRFAIVLPVSDMAAGHLQERMGKVPPSAMQVAYFASVEEAREWLAR